MDGRTFERIRVDFVTFFIFIWHDLFLIICFCSPHFLSSLILPYFYVFPKNPMRSPPSQRKTDKILVNKIVLIFNRLVWTVLVQHFTQMFVLQILQSLDRKSEWLASVLIIALPTGWLQLSWLVQACHHCYRHILLYREDVQ